MILVRNVFQMKFGKSKEALALWKEGMALNRKLGFESVASRMLTDTVGTFYTLVVEFEFESLAEYERLTKTTMNKPEWQAWYSKVVPYMEGGHREILSLVQ